MTSIDWNFIGSIAAIVAAISTLILAILTFIYVRATREMVEEMRETRLAQYRPQVFVDIETDGSLILVVLRNGGPLAAYDVHVSFDPPLSGQIKLSGTYDLGELAMFKNTKYLAPQRRIPATFWSGPHFFEQDLTRVYQAYIQYRDENNREFSEICMLDFEGLRDSPVDDNPIADAIKELTKAVTKQGNR